MAIIHETQAVRDLLYGHGRALQQRLGKRKPQRQIVAIRRHAIGLPEKMDGPGAGQWDAARDVVDGKGPRRVLFYEILHGKRPGLAAGFAAQKAGEGLDMPVQEQRQLTP